MGTHRCITIHSGVTLSEISIIFYNIHLTFRYCAEAITLTLLLKPSTHVLHVWSKSGSSTVIIFFCIIDLRTSKLPAGIWIRITQRQSHCQLTMNELVSCISLLSAPFAVIKLVQ